MSKKKITERTKNLRWKVRVLIIIDLILTYAPFLYFGIKAFATANNVQRLGVSATLLMSVFLCALQLINKKRWRSIPWVLLLGFSFVLNKLHWVILLIAICILMDEIVIIPLLHNLKNKYVINKEIDRRGK